MPQSRGYIPVAAAGLLLGLAACDGGGSDDGSGGGAAPASSPSSTAPASPTSPTTGSPTTASARPGDAGLTRVLAAGATALTAVGRGTVTSIDAERGGRTWEVEVMTSGGAEHEVDVSGDGQKVMSGPRKKRDDAEDRAENRREVRGAELDYRAAAQKTYAARKGAITELNLDDHRGKIVWAADVRATGTWYEVKVDAKSGKVLQNEPDRGDDDDD